MVALIESSVCLVCFYLLYRLLFSQVTFFQINRWYLLLTPILSFALPMLEVRLPEMQTQASMVKTEHPVVQTIIQESRIPHEVITRSLGYTMPDAPVHRLTVGDFIWFLYIAGVCILSLLLSLQLIKMWRLLRHCRTERGEGYTLAIPPRKDVPLASFFSFIFWHQPDGPNSEQDNMILSHELAHVKGYHSLDVLCMEALTIIQWFNPLIYLFRKELRTVHEFIADRFVIRQTRQRMAYATLLVEQAIFSQTPSLATSFHSFIKNRLIMIKQKPSRRSDLLRYFAAIPVLFVLMLLFSFRFIDRLPVVAPLKQALQKTEAWSQQLSEITIWGAKTTPVQSVKEPTSWILYWGGIQCKFEKDEMTGKYTAETPVSLDLLKESFKREPRLWNGVSLEKNIQFKFSNLLVSSNYDNPDVYDACRKSLNDFLNNYQPDQDLWITQLTLPEGKTGSIHLLLNPDDPSWLPVHNPEKKQKPVAFPDPKNHVIHWSIGNESFVDREFITASQFFQLIQTDPVIEKIENSEPDTIVMMDVNGHEKVIINAPETMNGMDHFYLSFSNTNSFETRPFIGNLNNIAVMVDRNEKDVLTYKPQTTENVIMKIDEIRAQEETLRNIVVPGCQIALLVDYNNNVNTLFNKLNIGIFRIVPDNDPRLSLLKSEKHDNMVFNWGDLTSRIFQRYARIFSQPDGTILYADRPGRSNAEIMTPRKVIQMVQDQAVLVENNKSYANLTYQFQYQHKQWLMDGNPNTTLLETLKKNLQQGDSIVLTGFKAAGNLDLTNYSIVIEVTHDDPKPPLKNANTAIRTNTGLVKLSAPSPQPVSESCTLNFSIPKSGKAIFRLFTTEGVEIWKKEADYSKGDHSIVLNRSDFTAKGACVLQLECAGGVATQKIIFQ